MQMALKRWWHFTPQEKQCDSRRLVTHDLGFFEHLD